MIRRYIVQQWRVVGNGWALGASRSYRSRTAAVAACDRMARRDPEHTTTRYSARRCPIYDVRDFRTGKLVHTAESDIVPSVGELGYW